MLSSSFDAIVPMLCVLSGALVVMLAEAWRAPGERMPLGTWGIISLAGAGIGLAFLWDRDASSVGDVPVIVADNFGIFVSLVIVAAGILTILFSSQVLERDEVPQGEYYAILLMSLTGMIMMAMANDLLVMFVALEILSLGVYVLTGIRRNLLPGVEGALKYFLLGSFSSAFFLYGVAFTYGVTGTTLLNARGIDRPSVMTFLSANALSDNPMILLALGLLLVGFAFKISAVPFHMWTPDAYEGAPAIVTGFMSTAVKAAAFAAFARVFLSAFEPFSDDWAPLVWAIAAATMIVGTVVGVAQSNLKRMLAYSSIAHGGYLLVGIVAANDVGKGAILFYLLAYAVTNLAAFGVIALVGTRERGNDELRDFAGLWHTHPGLAALMTVSLLSLGGLPPTAGFIAKWYVFTAAVSAGYYGLAIIGVLTSVISVFFYLRVVVMMYMSDREPGPLPPRVSRAGIAVVSVAIAAIFYLGILPAQVLDLAAESIATIF